MLRMEHVIVLADGGIREEALLVYLLGAEQMHFLSSAISLALDFGFQYLQIINVYFAFDTVIRQ